MLGCSTECPNCKHAFQCCPPPSDQQQHQCTAAVAAAAAATRRSLLALSGGGLVTTTLTSVNHHHQQQQHQPLALLRSPCTPPQVSPSVPLAFVLPTAPAIYPDFVLAAAANQALAVAAASPDGDLRRLAAAVRHLRISGCYYEGVSHSAGHELLKTAPIGSFLVRDSSDPRFLYSLSVQTERGPTSVRIHYTDGYFRLDAQPHLQHVMPLFPGVVELIEHYIEQGRLCRNNPQVWVDSLGKWYSPIRLEKPLRKEPPTLKHLSRLAVHKALRQSSSLAPRGAVFSTTTTTTTKATTLPHLSLQLPNTLTDYLSEYPFSL